MSSQHCFPYLQTSIATDLVMRGYFYLAVMVTALSMNMSQALAKETILYTEYQNVKPKYIESDKGIRGICVDILQALNQHLKPYGYVIQQPEQFTPIKRIRANLLEGKTALHCGAAKTKEREKVYTFSEQPLYDINTVMLGIADSPFNIRSLEDLANSKAKLSAVYGTDTHRFIASLKGIKLGPHPKEPEDGLLLVEAGRTDFFVYHDLGLKYMLKELNKKNTYVIQPYVFRHYSHWMIYSPLLDRHIKTIIENELSRLHQSGEIRSIINAYTSSSD